MLGIREEWKLSPMGSSFKDGLDLSGSRDGSSMRSEDSYDKNWREGFYKNRVEDRVSPKELVTPRGVNLRWSNCLSLISDTPPVHFTLNTQS